MRIKISIVMATIALSLGCSSDQNSGRAKSRTAPELDTVKEITLEVRNSSEDKDNYSAASLYLTEEDRSGNTTFLTVSRHRNFDENFLPQLDCEQIRGDDCTISYFKEEDVPGGLTDIAYVNNNPQLISDGTGLSEYSYQTEGITYERYKEENVLKPGRVLLIDKLFADGYRAVAVAQIIDGSQENSDKLAMKYKVLSFGIN